MFGRYPQPDEVSNSVQIWAALAANWCAQHGRSPFDDSDRFHRSRDVGAHLGLTPKKYASGETDRNGGISKCGDAAMLRSPAPCCYGSPRDWRHSAHVKSPGQRRRAPWYAEPANWRSDFSRCRVKQIGALAWSFLPCDSAAALWDLSGRIERLSGLNREGSNAPGIDFGKNSPRTLLLVRRWIERPDYVCFAVDSCASASSSGLSWTSHDRQRSSDIPFRRIVYARCQQKVPLPCSARKARAICRSFLNAYLAFR